MTIFFLLLFFVSSLCFGMEEQESNNSKKLWCIRNEMTIKVDELNKLKFFDDKKDVLAELWDILAKKVAIFYENKKALSPKITIFSNFDLSEVSEIPFKLRNENETTLSLHIDMRPYENEIDDLYKDTLEKYDTVHQLKKEIAETQRRLQEAKLQAQKEIRKTEQSIEQKHKELAILNKQFIEQKQKNRSAGQPTVQKNGFAHHTNNKKMNDKDYQNVYQNFLERTPYLSHLAALCVGIAGTMLFTKIVNLPYISFIDLAKKVRLFR